MKRITTILSLLLLAAFVLPAAAQDYHLVVMPEKVIVPPGEGVKFRAQLFTSNGVPVAVDEYRWQVRPEDLGEVSEDGFFMAGRHPGEGEIIVAANVGGVAIVGHARVIVGEPPPPRIKIVVRPERAVVPTGGEQAFEAHAFTADGHPVRIDRLRWVVEPEDLGTISNDGVFKAGDHRGYGKIIAFAGIDNEVHRGLAEVIVSEPPTGAIAGTVTEDGSGIPLADAKIRVLRIGGIPWSQAGRSDENGEYLIGELIPGFYVVYAEKKGYIGEFYDDKSSFLQANPVAVAEDDTVSGIDFGLTPGAKISGTVTDQSDGTPLGKAHVTARLIVNPQVAFHALSQEDGSYTIDGLPTGTYRVSAVRAGYLPEWFEEKERAGQADPVDVTAPDERTGVNFTLLKTSAISGMVIDSLTTEPLARAHIRVLGVNSVGPVSRHETYTGDDGKYIVSVPPGTYLVYADRKGYRGEFYKDAQDPRDAQRVEVVEGEHTGNIDFDLVPLGGIAGRVIDEVTQEPIAGALVTAFPEHLNSAVVDLSNVDPSIRPSFGGYSARTDDNGNYVIDNLPAGNYIVRAVAHEYLPEFWEESPTIGGATPVPVRDGVIEDGINFTLGKGGGIAGFVFSRRDTTPIPGAAVRVRLRGTDLERITYTHDDGSYRIGGLPSGSYLVYAHAEGFIGQFYKDAFRKSEATPVEVVAPDVTEGIDFHLPKAPDVGGVIAGRMTNEEDENPIPGGIVLAIPLGPGQVRFAITGPLGGYRIVGVPAGTYLVLGWAPGFVAEFYKDARNWRQADPILLPPNGIRTDVDFTLKPRPRGPYHVRGRVRSARDGSPLVGVVVYAERDGEVVGSAVSDDDGEYVIPEVPAGRYRIWATGASLNTAYYGGAGPADAAEVAVGDGSSADNIDLAMESEVTSVEDEAGDTAVPDRFELMQNYPNPFNPVTTIKYQLPQATHVTVAVYNLLGQKIRTLVDAEQQAGVYAVQWDGRNDAGRPVASGSYLYRIEAGQFKAVKKMTLLK